jgi:hypothetical protein
MKNLGTRIISGIVDHLRTRAAEWVMAAFSDLAVGIQLLQSRASVLDSTHAYTPLKIVATEDAWGFAAVGIGVAWGIALFLNGTFASFRRASPWTRAGCALLTASYHTMFAVGMRIGNPDGDGFIMHGGWAAMAIIYCAIIARELKAVDKEAQIWRRNRLQPTTGTR